LHHKAKINSLPAVSENVLLTTNERKSMSTKTNFKRLALGVIAALGLGMLSVAPASALAGVPTLTVTNGSATMVLGVKGETATAARVNVTGLLSDTADTYSVKVFRKSAPDSALADNRFIFAYLDTSTSASTVVLPSANGTAITNNSARKTADFDSKTVVTASEYYIDHLTGGYVGATFGIMLDSGTVRTGSEGAYVFTFQVTPHSGGTIGTPVTADATFTLSASAATVALTGATAIDPSKSTAYLNEGTETTTAADASINVVATADNTTHGTIIVRTYTSASNPAPESVTVTITGPGVVSVGGVSGKNITVVGTGGYTEFAVKADGTAGVASIVVKTTTVTFPAKTVSFYAKAATTITALVNAPVIKVGTNGTGLTAPIWASAVDADGNVWGGAAYVYASTAADALIAGSNATPVACTFIPSVGLHACPVSGVAKGTASLKVIDAATVALATATSNAVDLRVSTGVATTAVLSFDKATYAPGEKAQIRVQVLDEAGLAMPAVAPITNGFTADIATTKAFASGSLSTSATITIDAATSADDDTNAGHDTWVVYMPMSNGVVTISATGGTGLALAGRVALSASATVVNDDPAVAAATAAADAAADAAAEAIDAANAATDAANLAAEAADAATVAAEEARDAADAATAAVEELATQVATLMAALKAQITTLANTVAKIAKKVKA
jgi:hypothetical protein